MSRLIDADALKQKFDPEQWKDCEFSPEAVRYIIDQTPTEGSGMYECFHCGARAVIWDGDFDFSDYGCGGNGIVQQCHCENCGAQITYYIGFNEEE
jgi:hypothetical protein